MRGAHPRRADRDRRRATATPGSRTSWRCGGDPPKELDLPPGELTHATELIDLVRDIGDFSVGVAVHPEGHPASTDRATDRRRQAEKLARADFGLSQFFFDADVWFEFLGDLASSA